MSITHDPPIYGSRDEAENASLKTRTFRHDAVMYEGSSDFDRRMCAFIEEGLDRHEDVLVMVIPEKIESLRRRLGSRSDSVGFVDMSVIGANPARIIPAWRQFFETAGENGARGIGEPIWAGRSSAELMEAQLHESLINTAFGVPGTAWGWLICPYDTTSLSADVIDEALRTHPVLWDGEHSVASPAYVVDVDPLNRPLAEPSDPVVAISFGPEDLSEVRRLVAERAREFGADDERMSDLVLSVSEVAANSIRHGGGSGVFRSWIDGESLIFEIRDAGRINRPLVGRTLPVSQDESGFGLWLVNQLCDLVQVRSTPGGAVVRIHVPRA